MLRFTPYGSLDVVFTASIYNALSLVNLESFLYFFHVKVMTGETVMTFEKMIVLFRRIRKLVS